MQSARLLDVVIMKREAILELLACKGQLLLILRDAFLVLDLALDAVNRVTRLHIKGDGLASHRLGEDGHDEHGSFCEGIINCLQSTLLKEVGPILGVCRPVLAHVVGDGVVLLRVCRPVLGHVVGDGAVLVVVDRVSRAIECLTVLSVELLDFPLGLNAVKFELNLFILDYYY